MPAIPEDEFNLLMMERDEREEVLNEKLRLLQEEAEKERREAALSEERWHKEVLALEENEKKLQKRVDDLQAAGDGADKVLDLRTQLEDAEVCIEELEEQIKLLRETRAPGEGSNELQAENTRLKAECDALRKELAAAPAPSTPTTTSAGEELKAENARLTQALTLARDECDTLQTEKGRAREELTTTKHELTTLRQAQSDVREQLEQLQTDNEALMQALTLQKTVGDDVKDLQSRLQASIKREKQAAAELEALQKELAEAKDKESNKQDAALEKEVEDLKKKLAEAEEKVKGFEEDEGSKEEAASLKKKVKKAEEEKKTAEEEAEEAGEEKKKLEKEMKKLKKKVEEADAKVTELKNVQRGLKAENTKLKKKEKELQTKLEEAVEEKAKTDEVDEVKRQLVVLGKKYEKMKESEKKYEYLIEKLNTKLSRAKKEIGALRENGGPEEVARLKKDLHLTQSLLQNEKEKRHRIFAQFQAAGRKSTLPGPSKEIERSFSVAQVQCRALSTAPRNVSPQSSSSFHSCVSPASAESPPKDKLPSPIKMPLQSLSLNKKRPAETPKSEKPKRPKHDTTTTQETHERPKSSRLCLRI